MRPDGKQASRAHVEQTLAEVFREQETSYADDLVVETTSWTTELQIYALMAELINPQDNDIHVDFGCGPGDLMENLRRRNPHITTIGVEANKTLAQRALTRLQALSQIALIHDRVKIEFRSGSRISKTFPPNVVQCNNMRQAIAQHPALMIVEDMRKLEILAKILGKQKISSGSMTIPGVSNDMIEGAISLNHGDPGPDLQQQVRDRLSMEARRKTDRFMTQHTRTGGTYLLSERMVAAAKDRERLIQHSGVIDQETVEESTIDRMGDQAKYWDIDSERSIIIGPEEVARIQSPLDWSHNQRMAGIKTIESPLQKITPHLTITTLVRNSRKAA